MSSNTQSAIAFKEEQHQNTFIKGMLQHKVKQDMCLWNMDARGGNKVQIWQKYLSPTFWPRPTPWACDVSEVWGTHRRTYSPSLVTVSSPKL